MIATATVRGRVPRVVVSGGQSGVDRAALDAARALGIAIAGWCPRGRWAEDGTISADYPLDESESADPAERTRANVRDSDATLVLISGDADAGTELTVAVAGELGRPLLVHDLSRDDPGRLRAWLAQTRPVRLNVAGPRESNAPGIYARAYALLRDGLNVAFDDGLDERAGG
ncbi:MAG: putative molybdenum carrier protein [Gemmatimonas sp.]